MLEIQLRANASKFLRQLYSVICLLAFAIIVFLALHQDLSWLLASIFIVSLIFYFLFLLYRISPSLNKNLVTSIAYLEDERWLLAFSQQDNREVEFLSCSILTNRFALLNFKVSRWEKYSCIILHDKQNHKAYHQFAKWWHSGREKK